MPKIKKGDTVQRKITGERAVVLSVSARVEFPDGRRGSWVTSSFKKVDPMDALIVGWSREKEVREYAENRSLSLTEAVRQLTNSGLSYQ